MDRFRFAISTITPTCSLKSSREFPQPSEIIAGAGNLFAAGTMFDAARVVGDQPRAAIERDGDYVAPHGDAADAALIQTWRLAWPVN
jgi:hypothetical protein